MTPPEVTLFIELKNRSAPLRIFHFCDGSQPSRMAGKYMRYIKIAPFLKYHKNRTAFHKNRQSVIWHVECSDVKIEMAFHPKNSDVSRFETVAVRVI
jgi:hypothetical protein